MCDPIINLKQGQLRGKILKSVLGILYLSFQGIPFAKPPIGALRFQDPEPPDGWQGIKNATTSSPVCLQGRTFNSSIIDEDCLYLNVYTTSLSELRPVMVWIHGGSFTTGSGSAIVYRPDYLITKDIVLVSINYRLGVLGFLNLDHESAPGNQGLKDQVAALMWVKKNIASFGGDPNNITIFGESAGGQSVHYLTLSPMEKGLFSKAIIQSASANDQLSNHQSYPERAYKLASLLGKNSTDPLEVLDFFRSIPASQLVAMQSNVLSPLDSLVTTIPFGPNWDVKSKEPFFPRPIEELVGKGVDVPLLIGYNSYEASLFLLNSSQEVLSIIDQYLEYRLGRNLLIKTPEDLANVSRKVREFFFEDKPITTEVIEPLLNLLTDLSFLNGINELMEIQKDKITPTYLYRFSFFGEEPTLAKTLLKNISVKGAAHVDELAYLFYMSTVKANSPDPPGRETKDGIMIERLIRMWTNFAITGNPTPRVDDVITTSWKSVTKDSLNFLDIDDDLKADVNPDHERRVFWNAIKELISPPTE